MNEGEGWVMRVGKGCEGWVRRVGKGCEVLEGCGRDAFKQSFKSGAQISFQLKFELKSRSEFKMPAGSTCGYSSTVVPLPLMDFMTNYTSNMQPHLVRGYIDLQN